MNKLIKHISVSGIILCVLFVSLINTSAFTRENFNRVDEYILDSMHQSKISALTLTIIQENEVIYQKVYQTGDFKYHLDLDTPFYIGSIGKSITALAIKQLSNEGLLDINENVSRYLPWFNLVDDRGNEIKVRDLIRHRSGLSTIDGNMAYTYNTDYSIEELSQLITNKVHINNLIGNINSYSNLNYIVLGAIIEKISGLDYDTYVKQNIYTPLHMNHTYHSYDEAKENGLLPGYRVINGIRIPVNVPHPVAHVPAGFQLSSTSDMTNYVLMLMNQGIFESKSLFVNNVLSSDSKVYDPYWQEIEIEDEYYGHTGTTFSSTSQMLINQRQKIGILLLTNARDVSSTHPITAAVMSEGVISLLRGVSYHNPKWDFNWAIFSINLLFISFLVIDCIFFKRYLSMSHRYSLKRKIRFFIVDGILPVIFLSIIKNYFDVSWDFMINASPEYSWIVIFSCVGLVIIAWMRIVYTLLRRKIK